jgi:hypothetical protein
VVQDCYVLPSPRGYQGIWKYIMKKYINFNVQWGRCKGKACMFIWLWCTTIFYHQNHSLSSLTVSTCKPLLTMTEEKKPESWDLAITTEIIRILTQNLQFLLAHKNTYYWPHYRLLSNMWQFYESIWNNFFILILFYGIQLLNTNIFN